MNRRATPRPEYDTPTLVTRDSVTRHLWGDDESGRVGDEVGVVVLELDLKGVVLLVELHDLELVGEGVSITQEEVAVSR